MQSRNQREGRYAGHYMRHVRTKCGRWPRNVLAFSVVKNRADKWALRQYLFNKLLDQLPTTSPSSH